MRLKVVCALVVLFHQLTPVSAVNGYDYIPNFGEVFQQRERAQVMSTEVSEAAQTKEQCAAACGAAARCKAFQTDASIESDTLECTMFASRL
jgi:hypothetical protein